MPFTDEDKANIQTVKSAFVDLLNDLIRQKKLFIFCFPDLISVIYLRLRMHMSEEEAQAYLYKAMVVTEEQIQSDAIQTTLSDGTPVPYRPVEHEQAGGNELLKYVEEELTDEVIDSWFNQS